MTEQEIFIEVQTALNEFGSSYLAKFEETYSYNKMSKIRLEIPFQNKNEKCNRVNLSVYSIEYCFARFGLLVEPPNNDFWCLRIPFDDNEFWNTWNEFKRIYELKAFW
jgi:hypothetical protein